MTWRSVRRWTIALVLLQLNSAYLAATATATPNHWLLVTHIASSVVGFAVLAGWTLAYAARRASPESRVRLTFGVLSLVLIALMAATVAARRDDRLRAEYRIANPADVVPTRMEEEGAEEVLRRALELNPNLAALHPRDRVARNQLGRVLFLKRQFKEAAGELKQVLLIDPEDLQAHYNLMLSYQAIHEHRTAEWPAPKRPPRTDVVLTGVGGRPE